MTRVSAILSIWLGIAITAGCPSPSTYSNPHPTDDELRARLENEKLQFEQLAILFQENRQVQAIGIKVATVVDGEEERKIRSKDDWGYKEEPVRQMATLLGNLGIDWGFQHCPNTPNQWMLFTNCNGLNPDTTCKGYIWTSDSLEPLVESLDHGRPEALDEYDRAYVTIEGNWYLLYEVWPGFGNRCLARK